MAVVGVSVAVLGGAACGDQRTIPSWPEGNYCVLAVSESEEEGIDCPLATNGMFEGGTVAIDNEHANGIPVAEGAGASYVGANTYLKLCCGSFGPSEAQFPPEPFVIVAGGTPAEPECPEGFATGDVFIDARDSELFEGADSHIKGVTGAVEITEALNVRIPVCENAGRSAGEWPEDASFCVFAAEEQCPAGFAEGLLSSDDEDSGNIDMLTGETGAIAQANTATYFPLCCRY